MKLARIAWLSGLLLAVFFVPVGLSALLYTTSEAHGQHWSRARSDTTGMAPLPAETPEAVIQVYAARAHSWRGIFGVHTWLSVKPSGAPHYTRYEVFGWGVRRGREAVRVSTTLAPDGYWYGNHPRVLVDLRGEGVDELIERIEAAARSYPHNHEYRVWPGPNSNTFTAHIGRSVPELRLRLPPTAIGKDYIAGGGVIARSPGGNGVQLSLGGLFGLTLGVADGVEINLLGLNAGVDVTRPALKLPGIGRIGMH